jgi:phosphate transport system permease protein
MYAAILARLVNEGFPQLGLDVVTTAFNTEIVDERFASDAGMRNHLLGTLLLILLTSGISLPIGVGTGIFLSEYDGWLARIVEFCTLMLRAISVFILGVTAFALADFAENQSAGSWTSDLLRGYTIGDEGSKLAGHGSFLMAAAVLSLLVIPVIARATEEGMRAVPREMREGSVALGATEGHGLIHILIPWALPNIITGLLLGCAEAAGSVAVLLFIAGSGESGVGPLREVTSLAFLVFESGNGTEAFVDVMQPYEFTAALLLIMITFALSIAALFLKQRFAARYGGRAG